ncbi:MAG TPA: hypothetical protein DEB10_02860 [Ruminococcaceae bacterium]|jgi:hypothetical protein|nr:hypothetical protein [Oscillospiraceae bacterium]
MSKLTRNILLLAVGLVTVIGTCLILFLFNFFKTDVNALSAGFLIFAEILLFASFFANSAIAVKTYTMQKIGLPTIATLYIIATLFCVVFFKLSEQTGSFRFQTALAIEVAITFLTVIIAAAIILFSDRVNKQNQETNEKRRLMQICEKRISDLLSVNKNRHCEPQLLFVLEKLKYCDKIGSTTVDERIVGAIMKLEKELSLEEPNADSIFEQLSALIIQRNTEMADSKRGGF